MARKQLKDLVGQLQQTPTNQQVPAAEDDTDKVLEERLAQARSSTARTPSAKKEVPATPGPRPTHPVATTPTKVEEARSSAAQPPEPRTTGATKRTSLSVAASTAEWIRQRAADERQTTGGTIMLLLRQYGDQSVWTPQQQQDRAVGINVEWGPDPAEPKVGLQLSLTSAAIEMLDDFAKRNDLTRSEAVTWLTSQARDIN